MNTDERLIGDVAAFYLPYVADAIECEPEVRIICLTRPREEVIDGFCRQLDKTNRVPTNHWSHKPAGMYRDPIWSRSFPKYETTSREEAIGLYRDEYALRVNELAKRFPASILIIDPDHLTQEQGVRRLLEFVGIPANEQQIVVIQRIQPTDNHFPQDQMNAISHKLEDRRETMPYVNFHLIHAVLAPLTIANIESNGELNIDPEDESRLRELFQTLVRPYLARWSARYREALRLSLAYYLEVP